VDLIYDTMIHDTLDPKGAPGLASKWATPDPQTVQLTFQDTKFTDGEPFTSAAVKAAWERLLSSSFTTIPDEIKSITSMDVVDDHNLSVHLGKPLAKQWTDVTLRNLFLPGVLSPKSAQAGKLSSKPFGGCPDMFASDQEGATMALT